MLPHASHYDFVAVGGDVLANGKLWAHLAAKLVEERKLHASAAHNLARRRLETPREQVQERRLANAVCAEDANPLAAQHGRREIGNHGTLRAGIGKGDVLYLEDAHAARSRGVELERRGTHCGTPRREFLAQLHKRGDPPFVARSPRLYAAPDPRFLLSEFL